MKYINIKKISSIVLSGFILVSFCGCEKTNNFEYTTDEVIITTSYEDVKTDTKKITTKEDIKEYIEPIVETNITETNIIETEKLIEYSENDTLVINELEKFNKSIDDLLNSETITDIKDKAKAVFITSVDFIFYDGEINGVKFDELTESGKENVLNIVSTIDTKIENKFPNYKETIKETTKEAYNKASELIKKGANNIKDFSKEKLGIDNYNSIIEAKDELVYYTKNAFDIIGQFSINTFNKGKEYIKDWYNNFKK